MTPGDVTPGDPGTASAGDVSTGLKAPAATVTPVASIAKAILERLCSRVFRVRAIVVIFLVGDAGPDRHRVTEIASPCECGHVAAAAICSRSGSNHVSRESGDDDPRLSKAPTPSSLPVVLTPSSGMVPPVEAMTWEASENMDPLAQ